MLADNAQAQHHLYVCWKELIANNNPDSEIARIKDNYRNCTHCDKCHRTLLALDILGKTEKFGDIFDLKYWNSFRDKYIALVLCSVKENGFSSDLKEMMEKYSFHIPMKSRIYRFLYKTKIMGVLSQIRRIF